MMQEQSRSRGLYTRGVLFLTDSCAQRVSHWDIKNVLPTGSLARIVEQILSLSLSLLPSLRVYLSLPLAPYLLCMLCRASVGNRSRAPRPIDHAYMRGRRENTDRERERRTERRKYSSCFAEHPPPAFEQKKICLL